MAIPVLSPISSWNGDDSAYGVGSLAARSVVRVTALENFSTRSPKRAVKSGFRDAPLASV